MHKSAGRAAGALFITALLLISCAVWYRVYTVYTKESSAGKRLLKAAFLNVGQGDSILITTPDKKHILIDGGTAGNLWKRFDAGKMAVVPYLRKNGIKKLDVVVATHPDLDHIGGLVYVLRHIKADMFIDSGAVSLTQKYEELLNLVKKKGIRYKTASPGILDISPGIEFRILSPVSGTFAGNDNNNSIVIKLGYGNINFLFTADIEAAAEREYVKKYGSILRAQVLKLAHHGSRSSSSPLFLKQVRPDVAVVSCGKNNPFGHPAPEVIKRLEDMGACIVRTDVNGTVTVTTDGAGYTVSAERSGR